MEEKFLYHIWDEGHFIHRPKTLSGKELKVIYQGQYNTLRGPDFKNAIIEIEGETLRGDVEIHLKTNDWQAHNHQEDLHYNQVILHVVYQDNGAYPLTIREDGQAIEVFELKNQLSEDILKLIEEHDSSAPPAVYCELLSAIDKGHLESILHDAGLRRFESKIKRFNTALSLSSFEQVFYEGVFEALGYSKNKLCTLSLAQSLPLKLLKEFKAEGMSLGELKAIYLGTAGFLRKEMATIEDDELKSLRQSYENQPFYAKKIEVDWQLFRIRPQSHPAKRILNIAPLIYASLEEGLFSAFVRVVGDSSDIYKAYKQIWQEGSLYPDLPKVALGAGVIDNIYLNIFLPVFMLLKRIMAKDGQEVLEAYREFKPLQENYITRFMERYINLSQVDFINSKAIYQQGLMDIYNRYCNWHFCSECLKKAKGLI